MNKEWLKKVNMSIEESDDLQMWCENIGYERYEKIYNLVYRVIGEDFVNYKELRAIAKYDFSLSDILHSMMKLVELRFRSYLINHYGHVKLTKTGYIHEITSELGKNEKMLDCSTYYDNKLKPTTTLKKFLEVSGLETMFKVLLVLRDEELRVFERDSNTFRDNLTIIRTMRNKISHGQYLLDDKAELKQAFMLLLKYMPTKESKHRRINELEDLNKRLFVTENNTQRELIEEIEITLSDDELKEVGL
jgi:hypothetical protein